MAIKPKQTTLTANSVEILNTIRANATPYYKQMIPKAAANTASVRAIGNVMMNYEPLQNEFLSALYNRIGRVIITSKMYYNPWAPFKKGLMELGETTEETGDSRRSRRVPYYELSEILQGYNQQRPVKAGFSFVAGHY